MQAAKIEFWYDFASTYSYLSAIRIEELASRAGVAIEWKPFLLGPIFQAQGWTTSPFNLFPAKGRNMIRDLERIAADRGVVFHSPVPFPQNSLTAARIALVGVDEGWIETFSKAVFAAEFGGGANISDQAVLATIIGALSHSERLDFARIFARSGDTVIKDRLKAQTAEAQRLGIFGAPTFRISSGRLSGELFWGDDRLDQALAWAQKS